MAGLCEGGNEPPGSLKAINGAPSASRLWMNGFASRPDDKQSTLSRIVNFIEENDVAKHCDAMLSTNGDQDLSDNDGEIDAIESFEGGDASSSYCASSVESSSDEEDENVDSAAVQCIFK
ncbi:hypothetical protein ANN_14449 [Periplaneta americana]|uniref:Uncharacterized protein n=1 Tax=Periplaneta americana TaxID=6978 RepID=A0ABQ8SWC3_PERAM|nr:hypothetical protein ANN_14449 [Periplaneta americana]